uniref:Uncharacterized protein n=1 Tax=viral metagenome TaxID=1070528 RepID=A0A6M3IRL5_9ZZZZ
MDAETRAGAQSRADGTPGITRADRTGATVITQAHARHSEAAMRKHIFTVSNAVAGVAPGTALSTTPPMALLNPLNSGKELIIISTSLGYVSGTLGAGSIVYAYVSPQTTIPTGGTELTPVCSRLSTVRGTGRGFTGSTLSATPLILEPVYTLGAFLATTALVPGQIQDPVEGVYVVPPAACFVMQGVAAAGDTPLVIMSIIWEEIDII